MSGFWAFKQIREIIGFPTSTKKDQLPTTRMVLSEVDIALHITHVQAQVRMGREIRPKAQISQAISSDSLTSAAARKIRGKLGFYSSLLDGILGRE